MSYLLVIVFRLPNLSHSLPPGARPLGGREVAFKVLSSFLNRLPRAGSTATVSGPAKGPGLNPALLTAILLLARNKAVGDKVDQNTKEPRKARCSKKKLDSKKLRSIGKPKELKSKVWLGVRNKAQQSRAAVPEREEQMESEVPQTSKDHGLTTCPGARGRQIPTGDPQVVFLKTHQQRTPMEDMEQLEVADQWVWYEGLPTRIHLPGPRVMCRSSTLRWIKRCCTRFCSASLELPMCHPYKV